MRYIPAFALLAAVLFCGLCIQSVLAISADEWVNSGNQFNQQGRCQEALQAFENAINLDSKNKYAWTGKCGALLCLGRYDDALSAADFAQTLDQSDPSFMEIVLQVKGNALKSLNRNQEALDAFDKALAINANNDFTWVLKSDTLNHMGRPNEALQSAEKALTIDPTKAYAWNSKGFALQSLNRPQESLDAYNKALVIDPGHQWSWSGKSNVLFQMGRYSEALSATEQALAIDPTNAGFWNSKGYALLSLGRPQESLDAYNKAQAIDYGNPGSWNGKINVFITMGRYADAISAAEQALATDLTNANFWVGKGSALQNLNRLQESLDAYNKALAIDSGNPWAWSGKSNVLNQMGRYSEALSAAEQALAIDSGRADFWNSKGYALLSLGRYQESLDAFNAGLAFDATNQYSQNGRQEALSKIGTGPGSTISVTPSPAPLSVTSVSTPKIQSTPPSLPPSNSGDSIAIVMVNEPLSRYSTNSINGVPMAGYAGELVKWNGISWESSPVIGSGITDSTGVLQVTFTEKYPGTYYYKFHLSAVVQSWSNIVTVKVLAYPIAEFDAVPRSGLAPLTVTFTDTSTGDKISSRIWQYKLNSDSTWTPITLDGASSFTFTKAGSYDIKLTVTGTGGSDDEVKMNYINAVPTGTPMSVPESVTPVSPPSIETSPSSSSPSNSGASILTSAATADAMFRANPEHTGVFDNGGIVTTNTELWRFRTGGYVSSDPTVSNGVLYIGTDVKNLFAIDAVTGIEKWRFAMGNSGFSSPAVSNGVVYIGSEDKNLYAIDAVTGIEKRRFETGGSVYTSPVVSNGVVYFGSEDKNVYAIDAVTGAEKWRFATGGRVASSPAVSNGVVYFGTMDNNVYAIDAMTGAEKWRFATEGYVSSSPAVSNGVVYIGSYRNVEDGNNHILHAIDAVTGTEKWQFGMRYNGAHLSSPAVSNGVVYLEGNYDHTVYAIDAVTGIEKWRFAMGNSGFSSPAVSNGVVYIGSEDKNLYAIDAVTGIEKWRFETGGSGYYSPSSPSLSNGVVYVWSNKTLWAIGEAPVTPKTTPTAAPTPVIESATPPPSPSNSLYSKLSLPIIVILVILFLAGGGYVIYRMKKKPSGCKPPERKEKKAIAPHPASTGSTTKPELTLTLDRTRLFADHWDRITIQIVNRGNADAKDIRLTLSDEFDTKWIKPAMINAGAMTSLDIGIRPKVKGKIPLEVTALYHDVYEKEYRETHEFWIEVVEKDKATSPPSETPKSPVSQFTPRPLTPKQLPPDLLDRYTESEFIGKGGFARVFKAKRKDGKYVAVKIPISMDAMTGKSFIAEMQNWTKLSHPNIVRLYDFNIMPMPYFEEELCDSALADQNKPIECEKAAWILFNICEGLKFAHTQKIIHRDLKPQNILLKNGVPKISDWGLSRIISESTTTTATSFTPSYAAPEQINGRVKDERTDIWQLGVILYELVTGILPFNGDSMVEIGMNIATKDPQRPSEIIPDAKVIDGVVMKCLQKDPAKRYQSVLELQKDLALYLRENYTELLKTSVTAKDYNRSAYYCGDLLMINLVTGDLPTSYKYILDLVHYSKGDMKVEAQELCEQIKMRMEMGVIEIPEELIQKAEILVHQVSAGFRKRE